MTPNQRRSAHSIDWEYNVHRYENMVDPAQVSTARLFRHEKLQYYDEVSSVKKKNSLGASESESGIKIAKEIKLPSLKNFKSASMRLPGQKSSINEVQQLLRSKFNRIHAGLRKRRALSVQEVFQTPVQNATPTKPTFYVPSPLVGERSPHNPSRYEEEPNEDEDGPLSLPYINENLLKVDQSQVHLRDRSVSPRKERIKTWYRNIDFSAPVRKSDQDTPKSSQTNKNGKPSTSVTEEDQPDTAKEKPNFVIGGRVSLRERVENMNLNRLRSKTSSVNAPPSASPLPKKSTEQRKVRPRSHSPLKNIKINLSSIGIGGTVNESTPKPKRESFGLFGRLNRMMHGGSPSPEKSIRSSMTKEGGSSITGASSVRQKTDSGNGSAGKAGGTPASVSYSGNVSKQSTIQKLTQLSSGNRRDSATSKAEANGTERDRKSKQVCTVGRWGSDMWNMIYDGIMGS